ncbi:hypothetical protein QM012_005556 [Aureobasidium pullulans]|uniref:F-box domain-containing protein n=1 Tax=Aureobasidium pullulans TaxID=5580 RepID=A0ABR0T4D7_AURPU
MPVLSKLTTIGARLRQLRRKIPRPRSDTTALAVKPPEQSLAIPASLRMDRLPDNVIEQIFELLADSPRDVTNTMLVSFHWFNIGDKVLHERYSTKAALRSPRATLHPLKRLVFTLDDEPFHELNAGHFEPEYVELDFSDELFVSKYISKNLRYLRVSLVNPLVPLNKASVELANECIGGETHADWLLSLVDYAPGLETLILDALYFDVPQDRLSYSFDNAVCLNRIELRSPSGCLYLRAGILRLLARFSTLRTLHIDHIINLTDAQSMLQFTQWQGRSPFQGLETLSCHMKLAAADLMLPHLLALRELDITLRDKGSSRQSLVTSVFESIAKLTDLESLTITLPNNINKLPPQALMILGSLKSLKVLRINSAGPLLQSEQGRVDNLAQQVV